MDDLTFALDLAINAEQPRTHDDAAVFLEHSRPDDQIGDACLVLDGDEHDAFRRSRPLTDEDEPGEPDIAAIANSIERVAGNHLAGGKGRKNVVLGKSLSVRFAHGCWRIIKKKKKNKKKIK